MTEYLRLYRGDNDKVHRFLLHKTSPHSLVGQGIYLTDNERIAQSYRTKSTGEANAVLLNEALDNMNEARHKALLGYIRYMLIRNRDYKIADSEKKLVELMPLYKADFEQACEQGRVIIERNASKTADKKFSFFAYYFPRDVGYVTAFDFPKQSLEANVVNLETRRYDKGVLEVAWETKCLAKKALYYTGQDRREITVVFDSFSKVVEYADLVGVAPCMFKHNRLRSVLQREYGIHGFEYKGGIRVGGLGKHRAFSLWDSDFVNQNKVKRYR